MKSLCGLVFWDEVPCWGFPPPYMREIGTMWQLGGLTGKPCTFLVQNGSLSAFWHYKNKERLLRGLDVKWDVPSTRLAGSRKWFSTGICSISRASEWLWLETPETPQNGENVHGFQVRMPICHIVPVSRAYLYIPWGCGVIIGHALGFSMVTNWATFVFLETLFVKKHYKNRGFSRFFFFKKRDAQFLMVTNWATLPILRWHKRGPVSNHSGGPVSNH